MYQTPNVLIWTDVGVPALYWLTAKTPISILSICLPSIFFLARRFRRDGSSSLFYSRYASLHQKLIGTWSKRSFARPNPTQDSIELGKIESDSSSTNVLHTPYTGNNIEKYQVEAATEDVGQIENRSQPSEVPGTVF